MKADCFVRPNFAGSIKFRGHKAWGNAQQNKTMSKTNHTPAPWKKFWNGHYWEITAQPNTEREHTVDSPSVCSVFRSSSNEANADLIAAAPDLLAALEKIAGCAMTATKSDLMRIANDAVAHPAKRLISLG